MMKYRVDCIILNTLSHCNTKKCLS